MKKTVLLLLAAALCAAVSMMALVGCGGGGGGESAAPDAAAPAADAPDASAPASDAPASGALFSANGVDITSLGVEMVGDTPNLMVVFANSTDQDVDFDLTPLKVLVNDKDEVNFHLTSKTVPANTPYLQCADTASPGSMKVGDQAYVYYGDALLGKFDVTEF